MSTIFKKIIDREIPADIVYEDDTVLAFLDNSPIRKGHALIIPKKESINIFDTDAKIFAHMMVVAQKIARALMVAVKAKGVNIHMNNGHEAGQDVLHAHVHVIPRFVRNEAFVVPAHETYTDGESASLADSIKVVL
jgi:histidine triad (HIT) family protein